MKKSSVSSFVNVSTFVDFFFVNITGGISYSLPNGALGFHFDLGILFNFRDFDVDGIDFGVTVCSTGGGDFGVTDCSTGGGDFGVTGCSTGVGDFGNAFE